MKKARKLTDPARRAVCAAFDIAAELGSACVGSEHLLLGLARGEGSLAAKLLARLGVTEDSLSGQLGACAGEAGTPPLLGLSENGRRIMGRAALEAAECGRSSVASGHILLGVLRERDCTAARLLRANCIDLSEIAETISGREDNGIPAELNNNKS